MTVQQPTNATVDVEKMSLVELQGLGLNNYGYMGYVQMQRTLGVASGAKLTREQAQQAYELCVTRRTALLHNVEEVRSYLALLTAKREELERAQRERRPVHPASGEVALNVDMLMHDEEGIEVAVLTTQIQTYENWLAGIVG